MIFYKRLDDEISSLLMRIARESAAFEHHDIAQSAKLALSNYAGAQGSQPAAESGLIASAEKLIAILSSEREWTHEAESYSYFDAHEYRDQLELLVRRLSKPPEYRRALETTVNELESALGRFRVGGAVMMILHQDFESTAYWSLRTDSLEVSTDKTLTLLRAIVEESKSSEYSTKLCTKLENVLTDFDVASLLCNLYADEKAV